MKPFDWMRLAVADGQDGTARKRFQPHREAVRRCVCGHSVWVHHLTPKQTRTDCTVWTADPCPCQLFRLEEPKP